MEGKNQEVDLRAFNVTFLCLHIVLFLFLFK